MPRLRANVAYFRSILKGLFMASDYTHIRTDAPTSQAHQRAQSKSNRRNTNATGPTVTTFHLKLGRKLAMCLFVAKWASYASSQMRPLRSTLKRQSALKKDRERKQGIGPDIDRKTSTETNTPRKRTCKWCCLESTFRV